LEIYEPTNAAAAECCVALTGTVGVDQAANHCPPAKKTWKFLSFLQLAARAHPLTALMHSSS
jgi:hypothetical protein